MMRRGFLLGLAATAISPRVSRAQQARLPIIGMLNPLSPDRNAPLVAAFKESLAKAGFDDGRNVRIEYRWGHGHLERLPELARELVENDVNVIVATPTASAIAARAVTKTIPVVFSVTDDPVKLGLVNSFPRPGGNATGVYFLLSELAGKQFGLLKELLPGRSNVGLLVNPDNVNAKSVVADTIAAASGIGAQITLVEAGDSAAIDTAFSSLAEKKIAALLVAADPFLFGRRAQLAALSMRYGIAAIFNVREYAQSGGLISYGASLSDVYRQAGDYTARILNGAKPADLPVVQPTKFELVINLATAKAIGLEVPPTLLARADEVIE